MPIPADFHADRFAYPRRATVRGSVAPEELASSLQEIIERRFETSREPVRELERIVAELRDLGHPLELDEDDPAWTIYADLPHRNLAVWVHWDDAARARVALTEVLWQRM